MAFQMRTDHVNERTLRQIAHAWEVFETAIEQMRTQGNTIAVANHDGYLMGMRDMARMLGFYIDIEDKRVVDVFRDFDVVETNDNEKKED